MLKNKTKQNKKLGNTNREIENIKRIEWNFQNFVKIISEIKNSLNELKAEEMTKNRTNEFGIRAIELTLQKEEGGDKFQ